MKIQHYDDPVVFQERIRETLIIKEAENNLLLGVIGGVISGEYSDQRPTLVIVEDNERPDLIAICTPPFPVLLSYENPPPQETIIKTLLMDLMAGLGEEFRGITGNKALVSRMALIWQEMTGRQVKLNTTMRIYKLEQVKPVIGVPGNIRTADKRDREMLLEWYANFHRDAMIEEPEPEQVKKQVEKYLQADPVQRGLMIWEEGGVPVSMAGYAGPTPNGIRVCAVYTPPIYRKAGYASACTAGLSQQLLDRGYKFCFLFTDLLNPTSNHIYQQIGYRLVCDVDSYDFNLKS